MKSYNKFNGNSTNRYNRQHNSNQIVGSKKGMEKIKPANNMVNVDTSKTHNSVGGRPNQKYNTMEKSGAEDVLHLLQNVCKHLANRNFEPAVVAAIVHLNAGLKIYGPEIEPIHKDELEELTGNLRKACRESDLDLVARLQLLEIIEMRNLKWEPNETVVNYYKQKVNQVENSTARESLDHVANIATFDLRNALSKSLATTSKGLNPYAPDFTPTLTARYLAKASDSLANMLHLDPSSGKASTSDEHEQTEYQLSSDLVNFGSERNIVSPRKRRSEKSTSIPPPSPSGDSKASGDGTFIRVGQEYQTTIGIGDESIKILGNNQDLVRRAKLALEDCFAKMNIQESNLVANNASIIASQIVSNTLDSFMTSPTSSPTRQKGLSSKRRSPKKQVSFSESEELQMFTGNSSMVEINKKSKLHVYDRKALIKFADSPFSKIVPISWSDDWEQVRVQQPSLMRYDMILGVQAAGSKRSADMPPIPEYNIEAMFPGFVKSMTVNDHSSPDTSPRTDNHVSKTANRQAKFQGPVKVWDEKNDEWVAVAPALHS